MESAKFLHLLFSELGDSANNSVTFGVEIRCPTL